MGFCVSSDLGDSLSKPSSWEKNSLPVIEVQADV